ncbi:hypothetical protein HA052_24030 [Chromobacterium haemolyticum]|uniref:Uncharacterized protein n=1 Tax=Chromobacterium fluminis TaxID=3044269 RepID=A0ABX0LIF3_9NEIS|nr:hypothetical protein [Chromobacterium haemolyticum]NHR08265.1 hypothetical protein [Chromobacterium haemolyticum]
MRFSKARPHQAEPATALDKKRNSNAAGCEGAIILKPFSIRTSARCAVPSHISRARF